LLSCESLDRWLNKSVKSISQSVEKATEEELPFHPTNNVVCSGRTERRLNTFLSGEADVDVVVHRMVSGCWHHRQDVNLYREYISLMERKNTRWSRLTELSRLFYSCEQNMTPMYCPFFTLKELPHWRMRATV
ncbi:unnamed protein product, partial [Dicrocoelium dendriticum]